MAPIRYSLHYEDYSEHLMSRFGKLLQMQSLVDMTLMCSSHTLRVHKAVLAASSAYFQEVLQKQTGEPLIILKMRFSVLKCLVEFMYCGKTQCLEENLDELVSAAQFLKIKGLSKVTKEGLGITNHSELPVFTPPVVINRPPQSLIDLHAQEEPKPPTPQVPPPTSTCTPSVDSLSRANKDTVVRIPFDIENGGNGGGVEYAEGPRAIKPRRGRPSVRRTGGWDTTGVLGRAAERALLRREQDSRKAIHQLKHLQTRHMQDYMDRVTLSQAVNSICGPDNSNSQNYMNIDNDLMYMDQTVSSNVLDPTISYSKDHSNETITSSYSNTPICSSANDSNSGIGTAMSQYVNALKSAGLPTDLPILFESGDGSYINVNEQVLLDMVQSSEIQYEVIEQPNIIEKVADPSEIKSIDDLSKSIERGEMMLGSKSYSSASNYGKDDNQFSQQEEAINSLNAILPDTLESFGEQQNYVVLDPRLQEGNDHSNAHDFSGIDSDMQFFTKSMSDDVKKYYEEQQLNDARVMEQLCPVSTSLDTNFSMSLLHTKNSHINENLHQQYNPLNPEDDFGLQLPQSTDFKEDALDCLMSTPKQNDDENSKYEDKINRERDEIIKDLMNIEDRLNIAQPGDPNDADDNINSNADVQDFNVDSLKGIELDHETDTNHAKDNDTGDLSPSITSSGLQWNNMDINSKDNCDEGNIENDKICNQHNHVDTVTSDNRFDESVIDLTDSNVKADQWDNIMDDNDDKENEQSNEDNINSTLDEDIPYAVGLLPLKKDQVSEDASLLKRKTSIDVDLLDNVDAKCLKRKVKYKKM
ncbi:hypothetical protein ABMA28_000781 [Loxostege sticticalis]|uniref:BTB domain-containing protein n=1 Tax=Loxostege sticticalis TaxID=481309 RepID=A0ABD0T683_LOXSC